MAIASWLASRSTWSDDSSQCWTRLIYHPQRSDHISDALACLHWPCVSERIEFKIAVLTYKVAHGLAPGYLGPSTCVADLPSRRSLHFVGNNRLAVPISRLSTVGGSRAFSVASSQTSRKTWHQQNHWPNFLACYSVTLSVRLSLSVRNVLWLNGAAQSKSYYWQPIGSRIMRNRLVPKWMTLTFVQRSFKIMSTIASHSPLNIWETVRDRGLVRKWPLKPCNSFELWKISHVAKKMQP